MKSLKIKILNIFTLGCGNHSMNERSINLIASELIGASEFYAISMHESPISPQEARSVGDAIVSYICDPGNADAQSIVFITERPPLRQHEVIENFASYFAFDLASQAIGSDNFDRLDEGHAIKSLHMTFIGIIFLYQYSMETNVRFPLFLVSKWIKTYEEVTKKSLAARKDMSGEMTRAVYSLLSDLSKEHYMGQ